MAMLNHQMVILVAQLLLQLNLLTWCVLLQFALAYCWCWGGVGCSNVHLNLLAHLMLRWRWGCVGVVWKQTSASTSVSTGNLWCLEAEISECPGIFSTAGARAVLYSSYLELNLALHLVADYSKYKTLHTSTMCHHCLVKKTPIRLAVQLHPTLAGLRFAPRTSNHPFGIVFCSLTLVYSYKIL